MPPGSFSLYCYGSHDDTKPKPVNAHSPHGQRCTWPDTSPLDPEPSCRLLHTANQPWTSYNSGTDEESQCWADHGTIVHQVMGTVAGFQIAQWRISRSGPRMEMKIFSKQAVVLVSLNQRPGAPMSTSRARWVEPWPWSQPSSGLHPGEYVALATTMMHHGCTNNQLAAHEQAIITDSPPPMVLHCHPASSSSEPC